MPSFDLGMILSSHSLLRIAAIAACSATFAACGGGQSALNPTPPTDTQRTATATTVAASAGITLSGTVISADIYKFTVKTLAPSCGTMYVYYTKASTKFYPYLGYPVTRGMPIQAFGSGTCANFGSLNASVVTYTGAATPPPSPSPSASPTSAPTVKPTATPATLSGSFEKPADTAFMPSSWGKISAMQIFDDTANGYITQTAAAADGWRYSMVWGARNNIGTAWLSSNASLETAYYNALETDASSTSWGAIGHTISWWQSNHPDWVLYACTSAGYATTTPAYIPGLHYNVPLDIHNPAAVAYQVRLMANYAHQLGYHALAIDEATFWQSDQGVSGGYGCGIYQNGSFFRRYTGVNDPNWAADVVAWVKQAHAILSTDPIISAYHLKLVVNHPAGPLSTNETAFLANVDADLDESGYTNYGKPVTAAPYGFLTRTNWAVYAQQHGVAIMINDNLGGLSETNQLLDYSVATYLMGNMQAESLFVSPSSGYGTERWHSQYQTAVGAPCGAYYGGSSLDASNPSVYYRRFAGAVVVVNGGSGSTAQVARNLPAGHAYTDLFGRAVSNPLTISSNDGYVLLTSNGCI